MKVYAMNGYSSITDFATKKINAYMDSVGWVSNRFTSNIIPEFTGKILSIVRSAPYVMTTLSNLILSIFW